MKSNWFKSITLGLSALVVGTMAANAQIEFGYLVSTLNNSAPIFSLGSQIPSTPFNTGSTTNIYAITNSTSTNLAVQYLFGNTNAWFDVIDGSIDTDGAGKISGYALIRVWTGLTFPVIPAFTNGSGDWVVGLKATNAATASTNFCKITGKMGNKGTAASLQMKISGNGDSVTVTTSTNSAGGTGRSSISCNITGTPVLTNSVYNYTTYTNTYTQGIVRGATMKGSYKTGRKGDKAIALDNTATTINYLTAFAQIRTDNGDFQVIRDGTKLYAGGDIIGVTYSSTTGDWDGNSYSWFEANGTLKNSTFSMKAKGKGDLTGSSLTFTGAALGSSMTGTNKISMASLQASGKLLGQKVATTSGVGFVGQNIPSK